MLQNQVIALVKGEKPRAENAFTKALRNAQKSEPYAGISRTYQPKDEDGDQYPSESVKPQLKADSLLTEVSKSLSRLFDLTMTLEQGNTLAKADVVIDGNVLIKDAPVTYLLFLEKKLVDLYTFVSNLPTLDPAISWSFDGNEGVWRSDEIKTVKSKKILRNHVKAPATDKHPAQVDVYPEDVVAGYWTTVKFSGTMATTRVAELLTRVQKLQDAVKTAREKANTTEVVMANVADSFFGYLFA